MSFNSIQFALFLPLVFVLYWLVFDKWIQKCKNQLLFQNLLIVIASYIFYGWWDWRFLLLIALTSFLSWGSGILIERHKNINHHQSTINLSLIYLWSNIAINLLILGVFKYFNFFVGSFCDLFGVKDTLLIKVILPVGISFYTFQALSYSIDVYRGNIKATKDPVAFFAYVSFFPQLVAGPIERATNLLPQFEKKRTFDYKEAVLGLRRILWGLFKKVIVADTCAIYVDQVWSNYANETGSTLALAAVLFAFQIYGDFSGYSDIAIGTARLFGIRLKENFITPYFSRNMAEFWKRWHISLNTWFVDYVYIPLGGSRNRKWNTIRNTFVIFLMSGLWHGANWTYVGWGFYHALLFVPLIWMGRTKTYKETATWKQLPQILLTFVLATIGWIIFRAPSLPDAAHYVTGMMHIGTIHSVHRFFTQEGLFPANIVIIIMLVVEWFCRDRISTMDKLPKKSILRYGIYLVVAIAVVLFFLAKIDVPSNFIYFQF